MMVMFVLFLKIHHDGARDCDDDGIKRAPTKRTKEEKAAHPVAHFLRSSKTVPT
jgi:hypothetical protein